MARSSKYTPELFESICERLATGEPLAQICRDEGMPAPRTVRDWVAGNEDIAAAYARARDDGFDAIALEAMQIADESTFDTIVTKDGRKIMDAEFVARSKLRVETRLKLLAKWDPKRYGERMQVAGDPEAPLGVRIVKLSEGAK